MGSGIAQAAAQSGFHTLLYDLNPEILKQARSAMQENLDMLSRKGKIAPEEGSRVINRIRFTSDIQECLADLVIEAIIEKTEAKVSLFNQLAEINHSECVFATNTSSLSVTRIAEQVQRPERVIGMHFFNPATIMKLVEVIATEHSQPGMIKTAAGLVRAMGKTPVFCRDSPGFIVNRVARPYYVESLRLAEEEISGVEATDRILEATGFRMGPFKLMDLIGNDINYAVSVSVYEQMNKPERLKPSPLQKQKVDAGLLGRKTKKGYYDY